MSAVCILTPVVIAAWPTFSAAILAAAASSGYVVVKETSAPTEEQASVKNVSKVTLEMPRSQIVTETLGRDQRIRVSRDGVTIVFSRDARGKAGLCVSGEGYTEEELRGRGEALGRKVVQQYIYRRLIDGMQARHYDVVEEETDENQSIRIKVRHWES
ncbi:MAG: hypothetical protein SFY92_09935 [Verrucomicrobiae bacterium]|nr:hypothetical protein [Verrucomicrobiae bacterium]